MALNEGPFEYDTIINKQKKKEEKNSKLKMKIINNESENGFISFPIYCNGLFIYNNYNLPYIYI